MKTASQRQQDLMSELKWELAAHAAQIGIQVNDDVVKQAAANIVRDLMGVTGVSKEISVTPWVIASAVKLEIDEAIARASIADARETSVEVDSADIFLPDTVRNWAELEIATHLAWGTPGLRKLANSMGMCDDRR